MILFHLKDQCSRSDLLDVRHFVTPLHARMYTNTQAYTSTHIHNVSIKDKSAVLHPHSYSRV